jgi:hypothetical protein
LSQLTDQASPPFYLQLDYACGCSYFVLPSQNSHPSRIIRVRSPVRKTDMLDPLLDHLIGGG